VFGLGFGELLVVMIVAVVVLGPKDLPRYMRKAGEIAARLRRLAFDMREKSGIDEVLRAEGLDRDIAEIRRLARGEIGGVVAAVRSTADAVRPETFRAALAGTNGAAAGAAGAAPAGDPTAAPSGPTAAPGPDGAPQDTAPAPADSGAVARPAPPPPPPAPLFSTDSEYPPEGPDAYGALPESAHVYEGALPASDLATDPLYARGEDKSDKSTGPAPAEAVQ
jgi:sec-independent protein translocase protein TatB